MKNKVWLLTKIQLMRVLNPEFFKDRGLRKKRKRFLLLSFGMVGIGALIMLYSALISLGFVQMGMGEAIPVVMMGICSLLLVAISFMKSGGTLFGGKFRYGTLPSCDSASGGAFQNAVSLRGGIPCVFCRLSPGGYCLYSQYGGRRRRSA